MRVNRILFFFLITILGNQILFSQSISLRAPYTFTTTFYQKGRISAIALDTSNNRLHFQNNCNCGIGPGNRWTMLSYVDLNSGQISTPYSLYGIYGSDAQPMNMFVSNNDLHIVSKERTCKANATSYNVAWNYPIPTSDTIMASAKRNDTVFIIIKDYSNSCSRLELLNANTGSILSYSTITCQWNPMGFIYGEVKTAKIKDSLLYIGGGFSFMDQTWNVIDENAIAINIKTGQAFGLNWGVNDTIEEIEFHRNKIYISGQFTAVNEQARGHFAALDMSGNLLPGTPHFNSNIKEIEMYDDYVFALGKFSTINSSTVNVSGDFVVKAVNLKNNAVMNWNIPFTQTPLADDDYLLQIIQNKLFMVSRKYGGDFLSEFCLPPIKSTTLISVASSTVCEGSTFQASIPPYRYVNGYNWHYSGTGVTLAPNSNSVNVNFAMGATSGKLKVIGTSSCGISNDTVSYNITVLPRPGAVASMVDDTINCFKPKVPILGSSPSSGVSWLWQGPLGYVSNQQNDTTGKFLAGTYILTVTKLTTGCKSQSILNLKLDTLKPNVTLPPPPYLIPCPPNLLTLNGISTTTPSVINWKNNLSSTIYSNPFSPPVTGTYIMIVHDLYNGCYNYDTLTTTLSIAQPTVQISTYPTYTNFTIPADTVNCFTPSLTINATFSPTNCTIQWKEKSTGNLFSNPITVTNQGNYIPIVTRLDNSCIDSNKIILIAQDKLKPPVLILSNAPNLNCSFSTATLNAVSSSSLVSINWTGPGSFLSPNPAIASLTGKYFIHAHNTKNGCDNIDSVQVGYVNLLMVNAGRDSMVCKNAVVNYSAAVSGTVSPINYLWSNGVTTQNNTVQPVNSTTLTVQVNGGGCTGSDTVFVNVPDEIQDSIVTAKGCTGNSGNIVVFAKGGIPPYQFSLNGSAFTSLNTYSNLAFSTYTISIRDSIGCIRTNTASINNNSNAVQPVFIVSTKNFKGDTVVFVDITQPKADSIQWLLPNNSYRIGGDMFNPVIVFPDTGIYTITMKAFYGTCMLSSTKQIQILPIDSAYATLVNNNGIKSVTLFPNPNSGQFTVQVEFYKKQNSVIQIWDASPQIHFHQSNNDTLLLQLPVNLTSLPNGTYLLKVIGEFASKNIVFVISK